MFDNEDAAAIYFERAAMHEQLAATTSDEPARKMHQAMASEYRRKAEAMQAVPIPVMDSRPAMMAVNAAY
jgi:hypothetical protein